MKIVRVAQWALLAAASWVSTTAWAAMEPFVVRNFRVEGDQRIAEGTIYNYLPINIGDTVDERRLREVDSRLVRHRLLPGPRVPARRRYVGHRRARASVDSRVHLRRQQGHQGRRSREGADRERADARARRSIARRSIS